MPASVLCGQPGRLFSRQGWVMQTSPAVSLPRVRRRTNQRPANETGANNSAKTTDLSAVEYAKVTNKSRPSVAVSRAKSKGSDNEYVDLSTISQLATIRQGTMMDPTQDTTPVAVQLAAQVITDNSRLRVRLPIRMAIRQAQTIGPNCSQMSAQSLRPKGFTIRSTEFTSPN